MESVATIFVSEIIGLYYTRVASMLDFYFN